MRLAHFPLPQHGCLRPAGIADNIENRCRAFSKVPAPVDRLSCDRMFAAVVDSGSFAGGAARLGTSPGQASKLVSRLELDLGVRLLNRTTRALSLTEAGTAYHDRLREILADFDALDTAVRNAARAPRGRVRISAPLTFGILRLAPLLNDFAAIYPDIALDVQFSDRLSNLVDEGFDLAVRVGVPADTSLIARKLCDVRLLVIAAPAYLALHPAPASPADLAAHDCIIDTNLRDPGSWTFAGGQRIAVRGRLAFSNAAACLAAAEAGLGIAFSPDFVAGDSLRAGRVQDLLQDFDPGPLGVHAMYPSARHLAAKVRVLVDFLVRRLGEEKIHSTME